MTGRHDDLERSPYHDNYAEADVYTSGMAKQDLDAIRHGLQLISPKSNEQFSGNNFGISDTPFQILPYDRNRVRAVIQVPANMIPTAGVSATAQVGGVFIGSSEDVRGGGGFYLPPGGTVTIEAIGAVVARATTGAGVWVCVAIERQGGDVI